MAHTTDEYASYVDHPRYGRCPRITGLNPRTWFGWNTFFPPKDCRIPNTAIRADLTRQASATRPVTHYFDVKRKCRDCGRPFIFFAEEQKFWYEELAFGLDIDCVRCVPCRKRQQGIANKRKRYEELFHVPDQTTQQDLEMAECCVSLIEASIFHRRQTQRVRQILNRIHPGSDEKTQSQYNAIFARLSYLE